MVATNSSDCNLKPKYQIDLDRWHKKSSHLKEQNLKKILKKNMVKRFYVKAK